MLGMTTRTEVAGGSAAATAGVLLVGNESGVLADVVPQVEGVTRGRACSAAVGTGGRSGLA